jgi:predicted NUDIX family NTP pyrophosphohydrolase
MRKTSAGILLYRKNKEMLEVFLVHPGGPFFRKKDAGAWSVPKGEIDEGEDPLTAARREFREETGCLARGSFLPLGAIRQKSGKVVLSWAVEGDCDADSIASNTFALEWPPNSGKMQEFPEVDRAAWFSMQEARHKINPAQIALLEELQAKLGK